MSTSSAKDMAARRERLRNVDEQSTMTDSLEQSNIWLIASDVPAAVSGGFGKSP